MKKPILFIWLLLTFTVTVIHAQPCVQTASQSQPQFYPEAKGGGKISTDKNKSVNHYQPLADQESETYQVSTTQNVDVNSALDALDCSGATSHWRAFDVSEQGFLGTFTLESVSGITYLGGNLQAFVYSYTGTVGASTLNTSLMTLKGQSPVVTIGNFTPFTLVLNTPVEFHPGEKFVVEIRKPSGQFIIGANYAGETRPSYLSGPGCGVTTPTSYASFGYGFIHVIMNLNGSITTCPDSDGDGIDDCTDPCPNDADNDADADGLCGDVDPCPNDPDNDADADGWCGDVDNCPSDANPDQADIDFDGVGNVCDPVLSVCDATSGVISIVQSMELPAGLETSLLAKLYNAISSYESGNYNAATGKFNAFINQVSAHTGTTIPVEYAAYLITNVMTIIEAINEGETNCNSGEGRPAKERSKQAAGINAVSILEIFPNPGTSSSGFTLVSPATEQLDGKLLVFDALGKQVICQHIAAGTTSINLDLSDITFTGQWLQVMLVAGNQIFSEKLILMN